MSKGRRAIIGVFGGAGLLALLVLTALGWADNAAGAAGVPGTPTRSASSDQEAIDAIFARFAARLGTDEATIDAAFVAAVHETADEAVRNGQVSAEEAAEVKEMVAKVGLKGLIMGQQDGGAQQEDGKKDRALGAAWQAAATMLGLDARQLKERLATGKSLADVAQAQNVAVPQLREAMLAAAKAELDQAVRDGVIGQAQADIRYGDIARLVDELIEQGAGKR